MRIIFKKAKKSSHANVKTYVNVLKEVDINQNIQALTRIDEKFCFDHQAFETQFDYIREHDGAADHVLDKVEMELGRERE